MHASMETPIHDRSAKTGRARKRPMIDLDSHAWEFVFFFSSFFELGVGSFLLWA